MIFTQMAQPPKRTFDDILPSGSPEASGKPESLAQEQSGSSQGGEPSQPRQPEPGRAPKASPPHQRGKQGTEASSPRAPAGQDAGPQPGAPEPQLQPLGVKATPGGSTRDLGGQDYSYPESSHNYSPAPKPGDRIRTLGPLPWLGWKQLFIPVLFIAMIGIAVGVLTAVGHKTVSPPQVYVQKVPIIFVFHTTQGTITPSSSSQYTISMEGVPMTSLSYGGTAALSLLQASVVQTPLVIANWQGYKFRTDPQPPNGALVMSTPSQSTNSVAITISHIAYDQATQILTVVGPLIGGGRKCEQPTNRVWKCQLLC